MARLPVLFAIVAAGIVGTAVADAQTNSGQPASTRVERDFLFGQPRGWIGVRGTLVMPRAGGDLFTFVRDQLTVSKHDFTAPAIGGELGFAVSSRVDAAIGAEYSRRSVASEYRHWVDNHDLPINQTTSLSETNLNLSVKLALTPRGHSVSRLAWIPRTVTPYVGAGAGAAYYAFTQQGDFVDFADASVFSHTFRSSGWTRSVHVLGGTEVQLHNSLFLIAEGRFYWAHAALGRDFVGFDGIDLAGFRMSTGLDVLF